MSSGENSGGLMSSAGLVRYFDAEDRNAIEVDPKTIVAWGVVFGVLVQVLNAVEVGGTGVASNVLLVVVATFLGLTIGIIAKAATQGEV